VKDFLYMSGQEKKGCWLSGMGILAQLQQLKEITIWQLNSIKKTSLSGISIMPPDFSIASIVMEQAHDKECLNG